MDRVTLRKLARRITLTLIITLQSAHLILAILDRWGPPRKSSPRLRTMAQIIEFGFFTLTSFKLVERNVDIQIGRHVIQGSGIDALLSYAVAWSAAVVRNDVKGNADGLMSLVQLIAIDAIIWTEVLCKRVGWVERKEDGDQAVSGDEKVSEDVKEKMEV